VDDCVEGILTVRVDFIRVKATRALVGALRNVHTSVGVVGVDRLVLAGLADSIPVSEFEFSYVTGITEGSTITSMAFAVEDGTILAISSFDSRVRGPAGVNEATETTMNVEISPPV
jgi:hypothetical protein